MIPIDEQIVNHDEAVQYAQLHPESNLGRCYLALHERLKAIDAVQVPEEPKIIGLARKAITDGMVAPLNRIMLEHIDTLSDLLKKESARADSYVSGAELAAITILRERAEAAEAKLAAMLKLGAEPSIELCIVGRNAIQANGGEGSDMEIESDAQEAFKAMFAKLIEQAGVKK